MCLPFFPLWRHRDRVRTPKNFRSPVSWCRQCTLSTGAKLQSISSEHRISAPAETKSLCFQVLQLSPLYIRRASCASRSGRIEPGLLSTVCGLALPVGGCGKHGFSACTVIRLAELRFGLSPSTAWLGLSSFGLSSSSVCAVQYTVRMLLWEELRCRALCSSLVVCRL